MIQVNSSRMDVLLRARVHREDHRDTGSDRIQRCQDLCQSLDPVDINRAMQGNQHITGFSQTQVCDNWALLRRRQHLDQCINHDIAHPVDLMGGNTLSQQVGVPIRRGGKKQV